jgi:hypothetical protein
MLAVGGANPKCSCKGCPEPAGLELLKTYRTALNYALNKILNFNL